MKNGYTHKSTRTTESETLKVQKNSTGILSCRGSDETVAIWSSCGTKHQLGVTSETFKGFDFLCRWNWQIPHFIHRPNITGHNTKGFSYSNKPDSTDQRQNKCKVAVKAAWEETDFLSIVNLCYQRMNACVLMHCEQCIPQIIAEDVWKWDTISLWDKGACLSSNRDVVVHWVTFQNV